MTDTLHNAIERILLAGVMAPSGDNVQPWRFETSENRIDVFSVVPSNASHDSVLTNSRQALLIAHGALLENMVITANHYGYDVDVQLFPEKDDSTHTIRLSLVQKQADTDTQNDLYEYITQRATDRTGYSLEPLSSEEKELFVKVPKLLGIHNADIRFIEDRKTIGEIAKVVVTQVKLLYSHRGFHKEFYSILRWTNKQAYETRDGLDMPSLRLNILMQTVFHYLLSSWPIVKLGSYFGLPHIAAFSESLRYRQAGAYCAIVTQGDTDIDSINGGRILQYIWLLATRQPLSMQPTSATLLLKRELDLNIVLFNPKQQATLVRAAKNMYRIFNVQEGEVIQHAFRIGHSRAVPHKSLRKYPDVTKLID